MTADELYAAAVAAMLEGRLRYAPNAMTLECACHGGTFAATTDAELCALLADDVRAYGIAPRNSYQEHTVLDRLLPARARVYSRLRLAAYTHDQ